MQVDNNKYNSSGGSETKSGGTSTVGYAAAAEFLGVAKGTLYAWVHQRRVPHIRIGRRCVRFNRSALQAFLDERAVQVGAKECGQ